jgi:protocatechuate 3,4-dioxygenase beta subunit
MHSFLVSPHHTLSEANRAQRGRRSQLLAWPLALLAAMALVLPFGPAAPTALAAGNLSVRVYNDTGRDGVDSSDPGINAVQVAVYTADNLLAGLVATDATGTATFPNLADGSYRVEVTPPSGYVVSVPGAANTNPGLVSRVLIAGGAPAIGVGLRQLSGGIDPEAPAATRSVTLRVWDDRNADGIQGADEPGLAGLTLELVDSIGTLLQTATVGDDGRYRFDTAPTSPGLRVRVAAGLPAGYTLTLPNETDPHPNPDARDSDASLIGFPPATVTLPTAGRGVNEDGIDIGFARGAISGLVWRDTDADGRLDAGEALLDGVTVQLTDGAGTVLQTTTTRSEAGSGGTAGVYAFSGLAFGTYRVRIPASQFQAGALLFGAANSPNAAGGDRGSPDGISIGDIEIGPINLSSSDIPNKSHVDDQARFGFYKGAVGDFVWFDLNRDGLQTGEETLGQNGLLLFVDDGRGGGTPNNGIRDGGEIATTTVDHPLSGLPGYYLFDDLPLGSAYRIALSSSNFADGAPLEGLGSSTGTPGTVGATPYYYLTTPTLTAATPVTTTLDFGLTRADIGNTVFEDRNGNGIYDIGDQPIPAVTVRLYRVSSGALVRTTTSNGSGTYSLTGLPAVPYTATFDLATAAPPFSTMVASPQLSGAMVDPRELTFVDHSDVITQVNTTTWRTPVFTPAVGVTNNGVDAGFFAPTTITGRVFFDANRNDQDEATPEPGMRAVTVELRRASDSSLAQTTTTVSTGTYTFTNVLPGQYVVDVVNPDAANFAFVTPDVPAAGDPLASDVANSGPNPGRTATLTITSGTTTTDVDAGLRGLGQVSGRIFLDNNGSNTQDAGDTDLAGATATLTATVNLPNLVATYAAPLSTAAPNFTFDGLVGGTGVSYDLRFAPPAAVPAYQASVADQGGNDALDSDGPMVTVTNPAKGASLDYDQGYYQPVTITARVFEESSGTINNQYQAGNPGVANVTVALETSGGAPVDTELSDATGVVTFTVAPGDYRLNVDQTAANLNGLLASPGHTDPVAVFGTPLTSGENSLTDTTGRNSFGYFRPTTISGKLFFDRNLDDLKAGEPGIQGVSVAASGPSTPIATTDSTGVYTFTGLLPGNYTVTVINPDTANFAFIAAGDSDVTTAGAVASSSTASIAVAYGTTVSGSSDAGLIGRSSVAGYTFEDGDFNGQSVDLADDDLPDVSATLTLTVNIPNRLTTTIVRSELTDMLGDFSFDGLPSGTYDLRFSPPAAIPAWQSTLADQGPDATDSDGLAERTGQTLAANTDHERDQGYYQPVTITARVFEESSGTINNQYQAGNPGVANVTVALETSGGAPVDTELSDATGVVTFTVTPGDYRLNVDQADSDLTGFVPSPGHTDPVAVFGTPLASGENSLTDTTGRNSFGYYRPARVTGSVFFDGRTAAADNGRAGEPGMTGVTVRLLDSTLAVSDTTITDATGVYTFTNVLPGDYTVEFVNPDGANYLFSTTVAGDNNVASLNGNDGRTAQFSLASGATITRRAATVGRSTVSGTTFVDGTADGRQGGTGDGPLSNVTVSLSMTVNLPNLATTITRSMASDGTGAHSFGGLPGGASAAEARFDLAFAPPSATPPYTATLADQPPDDVGDSDGELIGQALAVATAEDRDQGFYQPVTITARVFNETTTVDNIFQPGEAGLGSVTVNLTGTETGSQTTAAADGIATFTVRPGSYTLTLPTDPTGFTRSPGNAGNATTGALTSGQSVERGFGYYQPATVTGSVFFDGRTAAADNGRAGEPGMTGVTVRLLDNTLAVSDTTITDATGTYTFTNVLPGDYTVEFVNPDGTNYRFSTTVAGDNNVAALSGNDGRTAQFSVTSGATITRRAATVGRSTVSGTTFVDGTADGRQGGTGDTSLGAASVGVTVTVNLPNLATTITRTAATDGTGAYSFGGLPGGGSTSFSLRFTPPTATPAWILTIPDAPPDDVGDSDGELTGQPLAAGDTQNRDQGYYQNVTISVRVFDETTTVDNIYQVGEAGVNGVTVTLNPGGLTTPTGSDGVATFTVAPGVAYTASVSAPPGLTRSPGNTGSATTAVLTSGQSASLPFGHYRPATISGSAWFDTDGSGTLGVGEPGMENIAVTLVGNSSGTVASATTGADGNFTMTGIVPTGATLPDANYRLCWSLPTGLAYTIKGAQLTTDGNSDVNPSGAGIGCTDSFIISSNQTVTTIDAGYIGALTIGDLAWVDSNANGIQDAGESSLAGVTVTVAVTTTGGLINSSNPVLTLTATSTASANLAPNYQVLRVPPAAGYRVVSVVPPLGFIASPANRGGDDARDSDPVGGYPTSVAAAVTNLDFGFYQTAAVGDRVWLDVNGNGTYDAATDRGLPGATVELLDATTQAVVSQTITLATGDVGSYRFDNVTPGSYRVRFTPPPGYAFVNDAAGSPTVDNDNDAGLNGLTAAFNVVSNTAVPGIDAGVRGTGSIAGFAWLDEDQDDVRSASETQRLAGIQATLTLTPTGLAAPLTFQATTGTDGTYRFANLPPGSYRLSFTPTPDLLAVRPGAGADRSADSDAPVTSGALGPNEARTGLDAGYRRQFTTFLPMARGRPGEPDLVGTFTITPDSASYGSNQEVLVTVTVTNNGSESTVSGFWVDFYLNPVTVPDRANLRWDSLCSASRSEACRGIAWYVRQSLAPGQSITLTSTAGSYNADSTVWDGRLPAGTRSAYIYVDSWNPTVEHGAVLETNESNNLAGRTDLVVTADPAVAEAEPQQSPADLPPRPAVPQP